MSIILTANESFLVVADAAATTTESTFRISYADISGSIGSVPASTAGATEVTVVTVPSGTQWAVSGISLVNLDTVKHTYTLRTLKLDGSEIQVFKVSLEAGYSLQYDGREWDVYTSAGVQVAGASSGVQSVAAGDGIAVDNTTPTSPKVSLSDDSKAAIALAKTALQESILTDYLSGLKLTWVSATALTVGTGEAVIPSTGELVAVTAPLALSGLTLIASTWYHVYLYISSGNAAVEVVTTAPSDPYRGTARSKTGDTTRRYLGSVYAKAANSLARFSHIAETGEMIVGETPANAPYRLLSSGTATTATSVSTASATPTTAVSCLLRCVNTVTSSDATIAFVGSPVDGSAVSTSNYHLSVAKSSEFYATLPIIGQTVQYIFGGASITSGGFYLDLLSYWYER